MSQKMNTAKGSQKQPKVARKPQKSPKMEKRPKAGVAEIYQERQVFDCIFPDPNSSRGGRIFHSRSILPESFVHCTAKRCLSGKSLFALVCSHTQLAVSAVWMLERKQETNRKEPNKE